MCTQLLVENPLASMLCIQSFSTNYFINNHRTKTMTDIAQIWNLYILTIVICVCWDQSVYFHCWLLCSYFGRGVYCLPGPKIFSLQGLAHSILCHMHAGETSRVGEENFSCWPREATPLPSKVSPTPRLCQPIILSQYPHSRHGCSSFFNTVIWLSLLTFLL